MTRLTPWGLVVLLMAALFVSRCGVDANLAVALDRAETAEMAAQANLARADSAAAVSDRLRSVRDSIEAVYAIDSAQWASDRVASAQRIQAATARASAVATDLTAQLDSVQSALFARYTAERDSIESSLRADLESLELERNSLWRQREIMSGLVTSLEGEVDALRSANNDLLIANEELHAAIRAQGRENRLLKLGGTVLLVWAGYERLAG